MNAAGVVKANTFLKHVRNFIRRQQFIEREAKAQREFFMGLPEHWFIDPKYRCGNGHVSKWVIRSEEYGDVCPKCQMSVILTHPDDREDI